MGVLPRYKHQPSDGISAARFVLHMATIRTKPCLPQENPLPYAKLWTHHQTKTHIAAVAQGGIAVAVRNATVPRIVVPATATQHTIRALRVLTYTYPLISFYILLYMHASQTLTMG